MDLGFVTAYRTACALAATKMMKTSVREIVANILGVSPGEIQAGSSPRDFAQWDSAAHIEIVLSVEAEYAVAFTPEEMIDVLSLAALEDVLRQKGARFE